jgi:hypothetical protein
MQGSSLGLFPRHAYDFYPRLCSLDMPPALLKAQPRCRFLCSHGLWAHIRGNCHSSTHSLTVRFRLGLASLRLHFPRFTLVYKHLNITFQRMFWKNDTIGYAKSHRVSVEGGFFTPRPAQADATGFTSRLNSVLSVYKWHFYTRKLGCDILWIKHRSVYFWCKCKHPVLKLHRALRRLRAGTAQSV